MGSVRFEGQSYTLLENESVLDGLLRCGLKLNHSCKAGVCGSCVMKANAGLLPPRAQAGLKDSWKERRYFLACVCTPEGDLEVAAPGDDLRFSATIRSLQMLSDDIIRARLVSDAAIDFRAGQYVTIVRQDGLARSYSIASLPDEGEIELHIRRIRPGAMSGWFHDEARVGDRVTVIGPSGECFYVAGREDQPLLLAGISTGLAPLYGILRDSLARGHRGPIHLFHGGLHARRLYLTDELRDISRTFANFHYVPAVLDGGESAEIVVGPLDKIIADRVPSLSGWRGFVCGDPDFVRGLKMKLFLAGMASRDIYADAFIPAAVSAVTLLP